MTPGWAACEGIDGTRLYLCEATDVSGYAKLDEPAHHGIPPFRQDLDSPGLHPGARQAAVRLVRADVLLAYQGRPPGSAGVAVEV